MVGAGESTSESSGLRVYYCRGCSGLAFILSCDLTSRPKRKTDGSWVVKEAKFLKTVKMEQGDVKRIRRCDSGNAFCDEKVCVVSLTLPNVHTWQCEGH